MKRKTRIKVESPFGTLVATLLDDFPGGYAVTLNGKRIGGAFPRDGGRRFSAYADADTGQGSGEWLGVYRSLNLAVRAIAREVVG